VQEVSHSQRNSLWGLQDPFDGRTRFVSSIGGGQTISRKIDWASLSPASASRFVWNAHCAISPSFNWAYRTRPTQNVSEIDGSIAGCL
jgi:hypothetical protein